MSDVYRRAVYEINGAILADQGSLRLMVTSLSMSPLLRPGDHVRVQAVDPASLRRGDLLVTQRDDGYLTHRLVVVDDRGWHTKGDRNRRIDAPVRANDIAGLVIAVERGEQWRNIRTRPRRIIAQVLGWLGWKEAGCRTAPGCLFARLFSRAIMAFALG